MEKKNLSTKSPVCVYVVHCYCRMNHFISIRHTKDLSCMHFYLFWIGKKNQLSFTYTQSNSQSLWTKVRRFILDRFGTEKKPVVSIQSNHHDHHHQCRVNSYIHIYINNKIDGRAYTMSRKFAFQFAQL